MMFNLRLGNGDFNAKLKVLFYEPKHHFFAIFLKTKLALDSILKMGRTFFLLRVLSNQNDHDVIKDVMSFISIF